MSGSPADDGRLTRRTMRWLTGLVVALPALLLFVGSEIYLRLTAPHDDLLALTGRRVAEKPIADWAFIDAFSAMRGKPGTYHDGTVTKTVNREGFISTPDIIARKPANTIRIAFLGESSTAGTGTLLPDSLTWPWRTAAMLAATPGRSRRIEFLNAALGGFTTFESFGRLWSRLRYFSPDIVVVYHGWNEIYYFDQVDRMERWRTRPDGSWGINSAVPVTVYQPRWYDWLLFPSQLLTKARLRLSAPINGEVRAGQLGTTLAATWDPRGLEIFRTNLRLMTVVARELHMELLVGKQATLIVPGLPEAERKRVGYELHGLQHDALVEAFAGLYRVIDAEVPGDHVVDVTPLSGVPENFYDHVHLTPLGAERTAAIMARALEPYVERLEARPLAPADSTILAR